ncbi:MAG: hypothetical protein WKF92_10615 [Pyrinomonadaceae bacterium]
MKKAVGAAIGCGGLLAVSLVIASFVGFFVYRNMHPTPSFDDVPSTAGTFTLEKLKKATATVTGADKAFDADYISTAYGKNLKMNYVLRSHSNSVLAMIWSDLPCTKSTRDGQLKNKTGQIIGKFAFCTFSDIQFLTLNKENRTVTLIPEKPEQAMEAMEEFFKALPIASDIDVASMGFSAVSSRPAGTSTASTPSGAPALSAPTGEVLSAFDLADKHKRSKDSVSEYNGKEITIRGYMWVSPTITSPGSGGLIGLGEDKEDIDDKLKEVSCWFDAAEEPNFSKLKGETYITVKGIFDGKNYSPELRFCKLVKAE